MPTLMAIAGKFPSQIQPWLLNSLEQAIHHGWSVWVASASIGDRDYPPKVDRLSLLERTITASVGKPQAVVRALSTACTPTDRGRLTRLGLGRAATALSPIYSLREAANRIIKAPLYALDEVDLLHSHELVFAHALLDVKRSLGKPLVHTFHGLLPKGVDGLSERKRSEFFAAVDLCLVNTRFAQGQVEDLGCASAKIRILPQGTDLTLFPFRPGSSDGARPLRILTVGRLHADKGQEYAIRAIRQLLDDGVNVTFRIVGGGPDEPRLRALVREMNLQASVELAGRLSQSALERSYEWADVFLLPSVDSEDGSHVETQGVVLQEAQASGAIVVATRTGGIPECIDDKRSGFLVPDRSPGAIAATLSGISANPQRWREWQVAGRRWVEDRYDTKRIGPMLIRLYDEVLQTS